MRSALLIAVAFVSVSCGPPGQPPVVAAPGVPARPATIRSPGELVAAMYERYAGKWYRNITFLQTSSYLRADGTPSRVETWYEAIALPGRLRIDLGDLSKGNGVVYRSDSVYQIQNGRITDGRRGWVAEEVRVLAGGRMVFHEEYQNVRVNVTLDENLFIPEKWSAATHWYTP